MSDDTESTLVAKYISHVYGILLLLETWQASCAYLLFQGGLVAGQLGKKVLGSLSETKFSSNPDKYVESSQSLRVITVHT